MLRNHGHFFWVLPPPGFLSRFTRCIVREAKKKKEQEEKDNNNKKELWRAISFTVAVNYDNKKWCEVFLLDGSASFSGAFFAPLLSWLSLSFRQGSGKTREGKRAGEARNQLGNEHKNKEEKKCNNRCPQRECVAATASPSLLPKTNHYSSPHVRP
jgi:hypothetical protein